MQILSLISNYFWLLWLLVGISINHLHCFSYSMSQKDRIYVEFLLLHILEILQVPLRGSWVLWKQILAPWFFAQPQEQSEMNEKKMRKLERKMAKRYQWNWATSLLYNKKIPLNYTWFNQGDGSKFKKLERDKNLENLRFFSCQENWDCGSTFI